jgi:hypothetical protein
MVVVLAKFYINSYRLPVFCFIIIRIPNKGSHMRRWEDNIKMDLRETRCDDLD